MVTLVQYRNKQQKKKDKSLLKKHPIGTNLQKTGNNREVPNHEELLIDLSLKESLDAFGQEAEETLAKLETPSLSYFSNLVRKTKATNKKVAIIETFSFIATALTFLIGVGYLLQAGYLESVVIFFSAVSFFLPMVILFAPSYQREEVNQR